MSLEKMFASIDNLRDTASVSTAFGEPQEAEGKIIIPVAEVGLRIWTWVWPRHVTGNRRNAG